MIVEPLNFNLANEINSAFKVWAQSYEQKAIPPQQIIRKINRDNIRSFAKKLAQEDHNAYSSALTMAILAPKIDPKYEEGGIVLLSDLETLDITGKRISILFNAVCDRKGADAIRLVRAIQLGIIKKETLIQAIDNTEKLDVEDITAQVKDELNSKVEV